jgi:hypothetical protein
MRISGRFARKMAENDQNTPIWCRLKPFIYLVLKKKEPDHWPGSIRGLGLPRTLGDAWKLALVCHVAEANTRNTELS